MAKCLHELFEARALRDPARIALEDSEIGRTIGYAELRERANALAHRLREAGVNSGALVPVCLSRGVDVPVALLGVLAAGAAYVPIDPAWPPARVAQVLDRAASGVVVADREQRRRLPAGTVVLEPRDERRDDAPSVSLSPDDLAYVLFTSGSTGTPKGVAVTHRSVVNLIEDFDRIQPIEAGDACSVWTSFGFDVSVWETFAPLLSGGKVLVVPDSIRAEPSALLAWLLASGVRSAYLPPSFLPEWVRWIDEGRPRLPLRRLLVGVEPIPQRVLARLMDATPGLVVINGYGPTETTICCTRYRVQPIHDDRRAPIGAPVTNVVAHVLDARMAPVAAGAPGELFVGGVGLARGYLDPAQTAERFVPNPFGPPGSRLYRTGDVVRQREDGPLEFVGRVDDQVKIRGYRIEPSEVASALASVPGVRDAVVVAREKGREKALVAYVVGDEAACSPRRLRAALAEKLPPYMMASAFVRLDAFPLNASGKVDRGALPAPRDEHHARDEFREPVGEVETKLAAIFADVLESRRVGADDDFFALGGDSIGAVRVVARVRAELGAELRASDVLAAPTVRALARRVADALHAPEAPIPRLDARPARPPLSAAQERLWFLDRAGAGAAYNLVFALDFEGALDVGALRAALALVLDRHEALRTTYPSEDGAPFQRVAATPREIDLPLDDLRGRESEADAVARSEGSRPFDLERGPICRIRLLRLADERHRLVVAVHHVAFDGWSLPVFAHDLSTEYDAIAGGRPRAQRAPAIQPIDFAVWERRVLESEATRASVERWRARLAGARPFEIPLDRPRDASTSRAGRRTPVALEPETARRVRELGRELGTTTYVVLLAAFAATLARGGDGGVLGTIDAGRDRAELGSAVGFFVRTIPSRIAVDRREPFAALVRRLHAQIVAERRDAVPFGMLVDSLRLPRTAGRNPLFDVMFAMQNTPPADASDRWRVTSDDPDLGAAMFDLSLELRDDGERLSGRFEHAADLFDAGAIERLAERFATLAAAAVASPRLALGRLPPLSEEGALELGADLPAPTFEPDAPLVEPRDDTERALCAIWRGALGVERIGVHDDFFALGGHSLLAARLVAHVRRDLDVELPVRAIFEHPTVASLASAIVALRAKRYDEESVAALLDEIERPGEET